MKYYLLSLFVAGALLQSCASQKGGVLEPTEGGGWLLGPVGGVNLVSYKTDQFAILSSEPDCFTAQNGSDVAFHAGLSAEIPLGDNMQNFIIAEGLFDVKSSKFTTANNTRADIPTKLNGVVAPGSVTTDESASLGYGLINVGYKYNFTTAPSPTGPGVQLCVSIGIPLTASLDKTVTVSASSGNANNSTRSETRSSSVKISDIAGASAALRIALRPQFDYDIPLTGDGSWTATPAVGYDLGLTKVVSGTAVAVPTNWSASNVYAQVAVRYILGR